MSTSSVSALAGDLYAEIDRLCESHDRLLKAAKITVLTAIRSDAVNFIIVEDRIVELQAAIANAEEP